MSGNILIVVLILQITSIWNDFLIGLTFGRNDPGFPNWFLWGALTALIVNTPDDQITVCRKSKHRIAPQLNRLTFFGGLNALGASPVERLS